MFWKWFRLVFLLILSSSIFYIGHNGIPFFENPVPPVTKLVNPYTGFWKNNAKYNPRPTEVTSALLQEPVIVKWEERNVPHIFAKNDHDLYFAQGYLTAHDRLWQMDFISRVSGGRVAEVVGDKAVEFDRFHRRIGLLRSAKLAIDTLKSYPDQYNSLLAYAEGVNAYIQTLKPKNYPIEFKILNYKPENWTPLKSALILKYMAWDLDGSTEEGYISSSKAAVPDSIFTDLFPDVRPFYKPIIPNIVKAPRRNRPRNEYYIPPNDYYTPPSNNSGSPFGIREVYKKGSNNWVINGEKSRSGHPILANDPHLSLSLPSIWYENQLSNGSTNVYGVSIPGVPMVTIGFNNDIAWGLTYTTSDPIDFTQIQLNGELTQYELDGKWVNPLIVTDTIFVKNSSPIVNKTLITEVGPIIFTEKPEQSGYNNTIPGQHVAMNWTAQRPTTEFVTMYLLNKAKNLEDYKKALPYFKAPGQNMIFASKDNDIAIWHNGQFPIRDQDKARTVQPSATSDLIWNEYIPFDELPHSINPRQNYLVSANQPPISGYYKYYLGADDYSSFERTNRINEVLDSLNSIIPYDFQKLQVDNYSVLAELVLPTLLDLVTNESLTEDEKDVFDELNNWNYEYSYLSKSPGIFDEWLKQLRIAIWQDEAMPEFRDKAWNLPSTDVTIHTILNDSLSVYFDNHTTSRVETRKDMVRESFHEAVSGFVSKHGSLSEKWQWGFVNPTSINSLANLPGFGASQVSTTGGSKRAVNALSGSHGPSWRMIVELGKKPIAYGVYPGGQSGNPGSEDYNSFTARWAGGNYFDLYLLSNENDDPVSLTKTEFTPKK